MRGDIDRSFSLEATTAGSVAWDIETSGLDWRTARIGTVQVGLSTGESAIVQIDDAHLPANLITMLEAPELRKIFHFAPFDLGFMVSAWSARPQHVVCTKVLAKIVSPGASSFSLKDLLERELGVRISKSPVRTSDWGAEELTPDQIAYASNDVRYLHELFDALMQKAVAAGVADLAQRSFDYLPVRVLTDLRGAGDIFDY